MYFLVHFGLLNPKESVDLSTAFNTYTQRVVQALEQQTARAADTNTPLCARAGFSAAVSLRIDAATACEIKKRLQKGQKTAQVPASRTLSDVLLGKQATALRIYERDLNRDLQAIGLYP